MKDYFFSFLKTFQDKIRQDTFSRQVFSRSCDYLRPSNRCLETRFLKTFQDKTRQDTFSRQVFSRSCDYLRPSNRCLETLLIGLCWLVFSDTGNVHAISLFCSLPSFQWWWGCCLMFPFVPVPHQNRCLLYSQLLCLYIFIYIVHPFLRLPSLVSFPIDIPV